MSISVDPNHIQLNKVPFDAEFTPGAYNAVNVCLRIQPSERVCVITDEATVEIAAAIAAELEKTRRALSRLGSRGTGDRVL